MKFITLLPLAAVATAIVIPDEAVMNEMAESLSNSAARLEQPVGDVMDSIFKDGKNAILDSIDVAVSAGRHIGEKFHGFQSMARHAAQSWIESANMDEWSVDGQSDISEMENPHRRPPHHKPPHHGGPHHPHHKPSKTVYELIASSKYTTKLASFIDEFDDLVEILNGTSCNFTVFAPTDRAFEKLSEYGKKPSKEFIRKVLGYHVSPHFYPAGAVFLSHTIPTTLVESALGDEEQRLRVSFGLMKGLSLNFFSKIVAVNIFGTNGVIHGIDSILIPPPPASKILSLLPGEFSTLELAFTKTGLSIDEGSHEGGTLFAPTNYAFKKLGPGANAFLFSPHGEKYLKALLEYHVVPNRTLYSDAYYSAKSDDKEDEAATASHFHVDLPTLLGDRTLSVDIGRIGRLIDYRINAYTSIAIQDGIAKDGVIQVPYSVLVPPRTPNGNAETYDGGEIDVEDLKTRLEPYVKVDERSGEEL